MPASPEGPILIIDDSADAREAMGALLETKGHTVVMATGADDALRRLRAGLAPSLICLDLLMSRKDGFAFRAEQLADPDLAMIPVVIYSGYHNVHYAALELGVAAYFQKPVDPEKFLKLVDTYRYRG
jgi:putative two-component system response regulator